MPRNQKLLEKEAPTTSDVRDAQGTTCPSQQNKALTRAPLPCDKCKQGGQRIIMVHGKHACYSCLSRFIIAARAAVLRRSAVSLCPYCGRPKKRQH